MEITSLRRASGGGTLVATFDLRLTPEIRLFDWQLRHGPKGWRVFPPNPRHGRAVVQVGSDTFSQIEQLARTAYEMGNSPDAASN